MDGCFPFQAECCLGDIAEGMLEENPENLCDIYSLYLGILL
jgi:hypothetical protein